MKKGIIMEMDDAFLTLLTPEGEFLRARRQNEQYVIGEEIHFFPLKGHKSQRLYPIKNLLKVKPVWVVSVVAALLIFLGSFIPMYQDNKAYAYMSIDVNPSIEIGVNKKMQVVELTGFNKEGKKVISSIYNWRKKDIYKITKTIFSEMKKEGFMKNNETVIISTVHTTKPVEQVEAKLKENLEEIKTSVNNQQLQVTVYTSTEKEREKALEQGITTGRYHEEKTHASINEKKHEKINQKQKDNIDHTTQTQPSESVLPPGQLKKETENAVPPNNVTPDRGTQNQINREDENHIPP
ncbi:MAG: anti-sigma factor domain-containing protein, partial [Neobacillus sp.]